jgi:hypothetical protein
MLTPRINIRLYYEVITIVSEYIELKQDLGCRLFIEGVRLGLKCCSKKYQKSGSYPLTTSLTGVPAASKFSFKIPSLR